MGGLNRGRLSVDIHGPWRFYTRTIPPGCTTLGVVTRDRETGALVRTPAGLLVLVAAGALLSLDQRKAEAALQRAQAESHAAP